MRPQLKLTGASLLVLVMAISATVAPAQEERSRVSSHLGEPAPSLLVSTTEYSVAAPNDEAWWSLLRTLDASEDAIIRLLPRRRVAIVRTAEIHRRLETLRADERVAHAFPIHHIGEDPSLDQSRYVLTPEIVVVFEASVDASRRRSLIRRTGLTRIRDLDWLDGAMLLRCAAGVDPLAACRILEREPAVRAVHPDWLRPLPVRNSVPADPLFGNQWHLANTGQGGGLAGADIGALTAWNYSLGAGVTIAVIDTGVDATHGDIQQTASGFDPQLGAGAGFGHDQSGHGTRVAGVAAATGGNGTQVAGVAWQATVMPIRLLSGGGYGTPTEESACFVYAADYGADVITNSWGPDGVPFPLPFLVEQSFIYAVSNGRGGLGCPIFWAAGNGNEDIAGDDYVGSSLTVAVGASTNFDLRSNYSDFGAALDLVAPSSGGTRAINTSDLGNGTTLMFGGTSASAPMAAGVAALMLGANPALDWSSVGTMLRDTAQPVQSATAAYDALTGHSLQYGHGRLDAGAAVGAALAAAPTPPNLIIYTWTGSDIHIEISGMPAYAPWALGVSGQLYTPIGSGPLFGVGMDAMATFTLPQGTVPFRFWAGVDGTYYWGAPGMPPGIVFQAVAVTLLGDGSLSVSNVTQVAY